jgi:SAM-dependent methyltransferase
MLRRMRRTLATRWFQLVDRWFVPLDRQRVRRTRNIRLIPFASNRTGGKNSYAEWAHVVGLFQTVIYSQLEKKENNRILDVGCGSGLLAIASEPFLGPTGRYVGLDVMKHEIDFCRSHYPSEPFEFIHLDVNNPLYNPTQESELTPWDVPDDDFDLMLALSVWTHLDEENATFYFREVNRVLKPRGRAIISFFILDKDYEATLPARSGSEGRYHSTHRNRWIFDQPVRGSDAWFTTSWAEVAEEAIGISPKGLDRIVQASGLTVVERHAGNWKEAPGLYFQDVVVLEKKGAAEST